MNNKQIKALEYLSEGYSIAPVKVEYLKGGKKNVSFPIPWKPYQDKRMTEEDAIKIFSDNTLSISIITGKISGLTVIDIDTDKNTGKAKADIDLFPDTFTVETQSGGTHLYYQYTDQIKQTQNFQLPGGNEIDIRNDGGLVIAPSTDDDKKYQITSSIPLAEAPAYLFDTQLKENRIPHTTIADLKAAKKSTRNVTAYSYFLTELKKIPDSNQFDLLLTSTLESLKNIPSSESEDNIRKTFLSAVNRVTSFRENQTPEDIKRNAKKAKTSESKSFFQRIDEHFITDNPHIVVLLREENVEFHEYRKGVFIEVLNTVMEARVAEYIKSKGLLQYNKANHHTEIRKRIQNYLIMMPDKHFFESDTTYINLRNGLYEIKEHKLLPHNEKIFSTTQLPFDYDKDAKMPLFDQHMELVTQGNKQLQRMIQQMFGYVIGMGNPRHKMHILYGETARNGKSVTTKILAHLLGAENVSSLSLQGLSGRNPHDSVNIVDKRLNISDEGTSKYIEAPEITSMTSEGTIQVNPKFKASFSYKVTANFIVNTNDLPTFKDGQGMMNRVVIIPFNYQIPEADRVMNFDEKVAENELAAIFNWALKGHDDVMKNGFFISDKSVAEKNLYDRNNNSVLAFVEDACEIDIEVTTKTSDIYGDTSFSVPTGYQKYCKAEGNKPLSHKNFKKEITRLIETGHLPGVKANLEEYKGLKLKSDDDIDF